MDGQDDSYVPLVVNTQISVFICCFSLMVLLVTVSIYDKCCEK